MNSGMKTAWKVVISILAALLVLFIVAEAGLRTFIANQVTKDPAAANMDVSFGNSPLTFGLLRGKFPHMTLNQPSTLLINGNEITGEPATTVQLDDIRVVDGEPVADSLLVTTELPNEFIRAMLNQQLEQQLGDGFLSDVITISDVSTTPNEGTFTITFTAGAAGVELRPVLNSAGELAFEAASTELFGFELPSRVTEALSEAMSQGVAEEIAGGLRIVDFTVVPGGLRIAMAGEGVNFAQLQREMPGQLQGAS